MLKEFIEKILTFRDIEIKNVEGRNYSNINLNKIIPPSPAILNCHDLSGVVDYIKQNKDNLIINNLIIHVVSHYKVRLISKLQYEWKIRDCFIETDCSDYTSRFSFGSKFDPEKFMIALQSQFVETETRDKLIELAKIVKTDNSVQTEDDGITQKIKVKAGVFLVEDKQLPNPVKLKPYRTFTEIEQPESSFIFRASQEGQSVNLALFESDGSHWKHDAITEIKKYFQTNLPEVAVIA